MKILHTAFSLCIVILLIVSSSLAFAQSNNDILDESKGVTGMNQGDEANSNDEETASINDGKEETEDNFVDVNKEELVVINDPIGAHVRMLQLVKQVTRNIYVGTETINYVDSNETKEQAQAILSELSALIDEIELYNYEEKTKDVLVEDFVAFKAEARDLTAQFRELVNEEISDDEAKAIREVMTGLEEDQLKELNEEIRLWIREHNAQRMKALLGRLNQADEQLIEELRNGNTTKAQLKEQLKNKFKNLNEDAQQVALTRLKEEQASRSEYINTMQENIISNAKKKYQAHKITAKVRMQEYKKQVSEGVITTAVLHEKLQLNKERYKQLQEERTVLEDALQRLNAEQRQRVREEVRNRLNIREELPVYTLLTEGSLSDEEKARLAQVQIRRNTKR